MKWEREVMSSKFFLYLRCSCSCRPINKFAEHLTARGLLWCWLQEGAVPKVSHRSYNQEELKRLLIPLRIAPVSPQLLRRAALRVFTASCDINST